MQTYGFSSAMTHSTSPTPSPEAVFSSVPVAEPGPSWPEAKQLWGIAWEFHWAGFGVLFSILALRSIFALVQVRAQQGFSRKPLFVAINALLFTLGATRALFLFIDPYAFGDNGVKIPNRLSNLLFGIAFPCLTSAFCLIHLAFLEVAKIQIGPKKLQSARFLGVVITTHFVLEITASILTSFKPYSAALLTACRSFFVLWGFALSMSFTYSGSKVICRAKRVQRQIESIELREDTVQSVGRRRKSRTAKVCKVTLATSILGLVCCVLQLYGRFGVYGLYHKGVSPSPWPWWVFQTFFRLVEFCMACTIAYSVIQRAEPQSNNRSSGDNK